MIKHLSGDYETVEYDSKRSVMLYDNVQTEAYPTHWHKEIEIIMPIKNNYTVVVGETDFTFNENEVHTPQNRRQRGSRGASGSRKKNHARYF